MLRVIIFDIFYVATVLFAGVRGGAPERLAAAILIFDFQLSHWLIRPPLSRYSGLEEAMFTVDLAAFVCLYLLSLFSSRYWPMWMAAVQGCVAVSHLIGLRPDIVPIAYANFIVIWSYVILALLVAATVRHQRRLLHYKKDPAWLWQLSEDYRRGGSAYDGHTLSSLDNSRYPDDRQSSVRHPPFPTLS